mgnify:CR=1 FL=1
MPTKQKSSLKSPLINTISRKTDIKSFIQTSLNLSNQKKPKRSLDATTESVNRAKNSLESKNAISDFKSDQGMQNKATVVNHF